MKLLRLLPRFRKLDSILRAYEAREQWSRAQIQDYQLEKINELWRQARTLVPHYQRLAPTLPSEFSSLEEYVNLVPPLAKQTLKERNTDLLSKDVQPGRWHRTGGSTGVPTAVYWEKQAHLEMLRGKYRCENAFGIDVFDRKTFLWGHAESFLPGWKGKYQRIRRPFEDKLRGRQRLSAYDLSPQELEQHIESMLKFQPKSLYGYSSAIYTLALAAKETSGFDLPSLELAILTAEPSDKAMRETVADVFGCSATVEYGSVECGLMAYLMPDGALRIREDLVFLETVPNDIGSYDILVTVLNNPSFPLLRYRIEDMTRSARVDPETGYGVLSEIQGRHNDFLIGRTGEQLHPMAVKHLIEPFDEFSKITALQSADGTLDVMIEAVEPVPQETVRRLEEQLAKLMQGFPVTVRIVDRIKGNAAGKHRWIVSDLAASLSQTASFTPDAAQH